jgi:hypothetical protein
MLSLKEKKKNIKLKGKMKKKNDKKDIFYEVKEEERFKKRLAKN